MSTAFSEGLASNDSAKRIVASIMGMRKAALWLGGAILCGTCGLFFLSAQIFAFLQGHLSQELAFFTVAEPFLAHVKLAFVSTLFLLMPGMIFFLWRGLANPFKLTLTAQFWFFLFTCFLFYAGSTFCYFITLPFGVKFLLGFESEQVRSIISVGRFVNFITVFILAFGLIFELPIFMVFSGKVGLLSRVQFQTNRRYALLAISIVAALLTPTPDVVNMLLMAGPLYLLYEAGILILKMLRIP